MALRPPTGPALAVALAAAAWPVTGCSFVAIQRLPGDHESGAEPECTSSYGIPGADAVATVLMGASSIAILSAAESDSSFRSTGWVTLGAALGFLVSATYGSRQIVRCRRAEAAIADAPALPDEPEVPGTTGAACKSDPDCGGALVCDTTMHTCIPLGDKAPDDLEGAGSE